MMYNWQQPEWPDFRYDVHDTEDALFAFTEQAGHLSGILKAMPEAMQTEAVIDIMVAEAIKTSEIEGEYLSRQDVVSSVRNQLGLNLTFVMKTCNVGTLIDNVISLSLSLSLYM